MALRASVLIDFKTAGSSEAKRAVEGIMQSTRRAESASKTAAQADKQRAKEGERALRRLATVVSETAKARLTVEKRAIAEGLRAQKAADREAMASMRSRTREDEKWAAARMQALRRVRMEDERNARSAARQSAQGTRNMRRGAMQMGAGALTLGMTGVNEVRGFGSTLGVRSREEMVQRSMAFERGLIRLSGQAGLSPQQQAATRGRIMDISGRTQVDPMDMLETATMAQNRFSDFSFFEQNAERFAQASNALDVPMQDIAGAVGEFRRQMGVTSAEIPELIGAMTAAAQAGSIEFSDVSAEFASAIGTYSRVTGQTGMQGAREFLAGAEVLGAGGQTGSQSAVLMQNLLAKLANADVQREMRQRGITTTRNGQFVGLNDLVQQLSTNRRTDTTTELQGVLGRDMQANQAMGILISEQRKAAAEGRTSPLLEIAGSSATQGNAVIDRTQAALLNSTSGRARQIGVNAEIEFMSNGDALIQSMTNMAGPLSQLENRFPRVAQGLETFQGALTNLLGVFAGLRLAGGGAVLASTVNAGAGTALAGGALGTAGTTAAGGMARSVPLVAVGAAAVGVGSWIYGLQEEADARRQEQINQGSRGFTGSGSRFALQGMRNLSGSYDTAETTGIAEELENARRMLSGGRDVGGVQLQSVMNKVRDIGATDEMLASPEGREAMRAAQEQINQNRIALAEQTAAQTRAAAENTMRMVNAIMGIQTPAPSNGGTTGPTE